MEKNQTEHIRELFNVLIRRLGLLQREGSECCGISLVQSQILQLIGKHRGISLIALADILGLEKSTMSRHIQGVIKEGYVVSRSSSEDKRLMALELTDKGEKICKRMSSSMHEYIAYLFDQIPGEKAEQVVESLELLLEATGKSPMCCKKTT